MFVDYLPHHLLPNVTNPVPTPMHLVANVTAFVAPDAAFDQVRQDMESARKTFSVQMYFIANGTFCEGLLDMQKRGVKVRVLVSDFVLGFDAHISSVCYQRLDAAGLEVHSAPSVFTFAHQKFWVVDGRKVTVSTGDWTLTDTPPGTVFPTYAHAPPSWVQVNRDFMLAIEHPDAAQVFESLLASDYAGGTVWKPSPSPTPSPTPSPSPSPSAAVATAAAFAQPPAASPIPTTAQ